jgi:hypothetical protein
VKRSAPLKRGKPLQRRTPLKRGAPLNRTGSLKRTGIKRYGGSLKRTAPRETAAERRARQHFAAVVAGKGRFCFFADVTEAGEPRRPDHQCSGCLDPHHLIAKSWIQRHFNDLPEDELLAIKYAPIIGCPLCRSAHEGVPANLKPGDRVFYEELDEDLIAFCERIDCRYAKRGRPSMAARLRVECPPRPASQAGAAARFQQQPPLVGAGADNRGGLSVVDPARSSLSAGSGESGSLAAAGGASHSSHAAGTSDLQLPEVVR